MTTQATPSLADNIPAELQERQNWLLWKQESRDGGKPTKIPYSTRGHRASSTNPAHWSSFGEALAAWKADPKGYAGIGYVFGDGDGLVGVDLDDCRDPATEQIAEWAQPFIDKLNSYAEVSPSQTGVKIWCKGSLPGDGSGRRQIYEGGAVEAYQHSRFFTVTGQAVNDVREIRDASAEVTELWQIVFGSATTAASSKPLGPDPESRATAADVIEFLPRLRALPRAIQGSNGSGATIHAACEIRRAGIYGQAGRDLLDLYNEESCDPEWSAAELDHKWESARGMVLPAGSEFDELPEADGAPKPAKRKVPTYRKPPVELLPAACRDMVKVTAEAIGCDEAFALLPMLTTMAGAIGNSRAVELKPAWHAPAILWTGIVGESGIGKTPAQNAAVKPLVDADHAEFCKFSDAMRRHEDDTLQTARELATWKASADDQSGPPRKPTPPVQTRRLVSDTTVEALAAILQANPRGVLLARDELDGWFGSFDRYTQKGGGGDEANWLSMYNAGGFRVDRKTGTQKSISVARAAVSIVGGIQPGVLRRALGVERRESGLAARFLFAYPPRQAKVWREPGIDETVSARYAAVVNRLFELDPVITAAGAKPKVATLSPEAKTLWVEYYNRHGKEQEELSGELAAAWSKLEETAARLALVIHYAKWASAERFDETAAYAALIDGTPASPVIPTPGPVVSDDVVDAESMKAGIALAEWFKGEAVRVYGMLRESEGDAERRKLLEWIEGRGGSATARELQRGYWALREPGKAEAALRALAQHGHGSLVCQPPGRAGGRPTEVFMLNVADPLDVTLPFPESNEVSSSVEASRMCRVGA